MPDNSRSIVLDNLGALRAYRHGLSGWCLDCSALYRRDRLQNRPAAFAIDLEALIAERGARCPVIGLAAVPCPYCGSRRTEFRIGARGRADRRRAKGDAPGNSIKARRSAARRLR